MVVSCSTCDVSFSTNDFSWGSESDGPVRVVGRLVATVLPLPPAEAWKPEVSGRGGLIDDRKGCLAVVVSGPPIVATPDVRFLDLNCS